MPELPKELGRRPGAKPGKPPSRDALWEYLQASPRLQRPLQASSQTSGRRHDSSCVCELHPQAQVGCTGADVGADKGLARHARACMRAHCRCPAQPCACTRPGHCPCLQKQSSQHAHLRKSKHTSACWPRSASAAPPLLVRAMRAIRVRSWE